jgi:hypothetical protein
VGASGAHQVAGTQPGDGPQAIVVTFDAPNGNAKVQLGPTLTQQEVIELEAADEPATTRDYMVFAAIADMAPLPFPQPGGIVARR